MNFSVCLIARNEELTLPRLVKSLEEFQKRGGKILLLDTGSTDKTAEVARNLGCEVYEVGSMFIRTIDADLAAAVNKKFIYEDDPPVVKAGDKLFNFAAARNYIAQFSPTDVIAMPDCDEIYTKLDLDKIEQVITDGAEQLKYNFVFSHDQFGNEAMKFEHCKFYDRRKMSWVGMVHEVLVGETKTVHLGEDVIKLEHYQNPKTNRGNYLVGLALDCYENPDDPRKCFYFGREMAWTGRPKSAIRELERHIKMPTAWLPEKSKGMMLIGKCWGDLGFEGTMLDWYFRAFIVDSSRREPLLSLAEHFYHKKDAQKAACFAQASLEISESLAYWDDRSRNAVLPHEILYWAQWHLGDKLGSKFHFMRALALQPTNPKFLSDAKFYDLDISPEQGYADRGIDGWMTIRELNWLYQNAKQFKSIVEVGSWKGRSTHALLSGAAGEVTAIDTWKGSSDPKDGTHGQDTFEEFKKNVGSFKNLKIVRATGDEAAKQFEDKSVEMVFIDAGHTYEEVLEDIKTWLPKAKVLICGHDYSSAWPGVVQAVDESFGKPDGVADSIWWKKL